MATIEQMEKKRSRQIVEILEAVQTVLIEVVGLKAEVAGLKADIGRDGTTDRTDEILAAIRSTALDIGQQTGQALKAIESTADEMVNIKAEIAGLKFTAVTSSPAATRRTKK